MIQVNGTIKTAADIPHELMQTLTTMVTKSRAEDGCLDYTYARDITDPETIVVYERWRDQAALTAHSQSAHMREFRAALAPGAVHSRALRLYETDEGREL